MGYVGVPPQSGFITTAKQRVTSSTNNYVDLDHSISSLADVIVFVNFVKQDYTNLTLTTSTRITLGGTLVASDIVEIAYLGKAVATQNPSTNSVTNDMLVNSSITLNGSAVSLGGSASVNNTPACLITKGATTVFSNDTLTKLAFDTEVYDTDNAFSSNKFTVPSGKAGKYYINIQADIDSQADGNLDYALIYIYKNGSDIRRHNYDFRNNPARRFNTQITSILQLAESDYIEGYVYAFDNSGTPQYVAGNSNKNGTQFMMYRIIE